MPATHEGTQLSGSDHFAFLSKSNEKLSGERLSDLAARAKLGDIEGVAAEAKLSGKDVVRLARTSLVAATEKASAPAERVLSTTRQILRTPDARKLARELLAIFAKETSSKLASNRFLFLQSPSIDVTVLQGRFGECVAGREMFDGLQRSGKLSKARNLLSTLSLWKEDEKKGTARKKNCIQSDVVRYFYSRRRMLEVAEALFAEEDLNALAAFLSKGSSPPETKNALIQIRKNLKAADELTIPDAEAMISDVEIAINEELQRSRKRGSLDRERVKGIIENQAVQLSSQLGMNAEEEDELKKAVFEGMVSSSSSSSFEFDRRRLRETLDIWRQRRTEELAQRLEKVEASLRSFIGVTDCLLERLVLLDEVLATASLMEKYSLTIPTLHSGGISFVKGLNPFLLLREKENAASQTHDTVQSVDYSIGMTTTAETQEVVPPRNVVMLTGANSGGKTTLLTTLASIQILSLYGLPVPCESAEVSPMPVYLFRRRMTRKIGSLEQALRSLIPVFASPSPNGKQSLVLIDEFEALTEPGAAGRIIATMMNRAALGNNLVLLVTHLARETLPHIKLPIRVDGIEASGFDPKTGELVVDRQPKFNHIGSSSPQHIVKKLSKTGSAKSGARALYEEILEALGSESSVPFQAPLLFPWMNSGNSKKGEG